MKVIDFFECDNRNYWLEQIAKIDWCSGKYLYELLKSNSFHEKVGSFAKVLLLVDGDYLLAFCMVSQKKYDIDSQFGRWIGFVYTFLEYRGKHYSNLLLHYVEKIVSEYGVEKIYISTKHIELYEIYGYEFYQIMIDWRNDEQKIYCKKITENVLVY